MAIFRKINFGLSKTRNKMAGAIDDMLDSFDSFEEDLYTELEEILVTGIDDDLHPSALATLCKCPYDIISFNPGLFNHKYTHQLKEFLHHGYLSLKIIGSW